MAKYMLLIYGDAEQWNSMPAEQSEAHMAAHGTFQATAGSALVDGAQLEAPPTATTVRSDGDGGVTITDGPFLETKEVIAGFCIIEASDLDAALAIAKTNPICHQGGGVEVRPVEDWVIPTRNVHAHEH
jgi:hypothetical protein